MLKPTSAKYIATRICQALGITHDAIPLTNTFYRDEFQISGPYLNTLSDLLISENYVGYMDATERLVFINLNERGGSGPVLDEDRVVDISPINVGEPDADVVYSIVSTKRIKLDVSVDASSSGSGGGGGSGTGETPEQILERNNIPVVPETVAAITSSGDTGDATETTYTYGYRSSYWLSGYTREPEQTMNFRYQEDKNSPVITATITYTPSSRWVARYSPDGEPLERHEDKQGVWGTYSTEAYYSSRMDGDTETTSEIVYRYAPGAEIVLACGFPDSVIPPLPRDILAYSPGTTLIDKTITTTVATPQETITTESRVVASVFTSIGAANIQQYINSFFNPKTGKLMSSVPIASIVQDAKALHFDGTRVTYGQKNPQQSIRNRSSVAQNTGATPVSSASIGLASLTDREREDLVNRELEAPQSGDPDSVLRSNNSGGVGSVVDSRNGYVYNVVDVPEILYTKNTAGGVMLEYTPPFLPDDKVSSVGNRYTVSPSDAVEKAKAFASRQNALRYGYRNGQAVVFPVEYTPTRPFSPVYLRFGGIAGQYRTDRLSIAFDSTGILVSTDAIFWGGVGQ
jgi:hypothetical protein